MFLVTGNRSQDCKYIYELPYTERKWLCNILDINDQWEKLGGEKMGFSILELNEIKRAEKCGDSPTDRLLQYWGQRNNTILKLYFLLYSMEHFQAMNVLLPFIPKEYHYEYLHHEIQMKADPNKAKKQAQAEAAAFPRPDPNLLTDLRPKNSHHDHNFCHNSSPSQNAAMEMKGKIPEHLLAVMTKAEQTQFPSLCNRGTSPSDTGNAAAPTGKILNTAVPPEQMKFGAYSSNEDNLEVNNSQLQGRRKKEFKQKVKINMNGAEALPFWKNMTLSENGSEGEGRQRDISTKESSPTASGKKYQSNCGVPIIPFKELEDATCSWNRQQLLGSGGFGSVYKGTWINVKVAIKRINRNAQESNHTGSSHNTQLMDELRFLQKFRHDNILQVYGFSADPGKPYCLVYQLMSNGSLEYRLQCRKLDVISESAPVPLNWRQRFVIARGTAAALQFLHTVQEKPLIHGDVKSANILLDDHLEPKLGDFGLAREGPHSNYTSMKVSHVHGTRPYIPEEYLRSKKLSTKVDTYSFGIVLFEICSGRRAFNDKTRKYLKDEVLEAWDSYDLKDTKAGSENDKVFDVLYDTGMNCIHKVPKKRPDMNIVFQSFENVGKVLKSEQEIHRRTSMEESVYGGSSHMNPLAFTSISTSPSNFHPHSPFMQHLHPSFMHPLQRVITPHFHPIPASPYPHLHPSRSPVPPSMMSPIPRSPNHGWMTGLSPVENRTSESSTIHHPTPLSPISQGSEKVVDASSPNLTLIPAFSRLKIQPPSETQEKVHSSASSSSLLSPSSSEISSDLSLEMSRTSSSPSSCRCDESRLNTNTVTEVCIPILSQLGTNLGAKESKRSSEGSSEGKANKTVSAQGKKSFLD